MPRTGYVNLSIPGELADAIDEHIRKNKLGYRSKAEYCIYLIRKELEPKNQ